jgi:hypothetical protein
VKVHELKCWPTEFEAVKYGRKDFEIRRDDRGFSEGDIVILREYRVTEETSEEHGRSWPAGYSGRDLGPFKIGYVERSACLPAGWCGFRLLPMCVDR